VKTKLIKKMPVMYPGKITDSNGKVHTWTAQDLRELACNYSAASPEKGAPVLLSHEVKGKPRYGWVENAWVDGDGKGNDALFCSAQVSEKLFEYSKDGHFPNRSISVFPESKRINHLALLGAEMPAFDNLGPAEFSETGEATAEFSLPADYSLWIENGDIVGAIRSEMSELERRMNDKFKEIEALMNNAAQFSKTGVSDNSAQGAQATATAAADFAAQEAKLAAIKSEIVELEKKKEDAFKEQAASFVQGLVEQAKIQPQLREVVEKDVLAQFSKGDKESTAAVKQKYLSLAPILGGTLPKGTSIKTSGNAVTDITEKACCYQKEQAEKGVEVDFKTALAAISKS